MSLAMTYGRSRPRGLTVLSILAIVLGILGIAYGVLLTTALTTGSVGKDIPPTRRFEQMRQEAVEMETRTLPFRIGMGVAGLVVASALLAGGIMALCGASVGGRALRAVFLLAALFEISRFAVNLPLELESVSIVNRHVNPLGQREGGFSISELKRQEAMQDALRSKDLVLWTGLVVWVVATLVKAGLYLYGMRYLARAEVKEYFAAKMFSGSERINVNR